MNRLSKLHLWFHHHKIHSFVIAVILCIFSVCVFPAVSQQIVEASFHFIGKAHRSKAGYPFLNVVLFALFLPAPVGFIMSAIVPQWFTEKKNWLRLYRFSLTVLILGAIGAAYVFTASSTWHLGWQRAHFTIGPIVVNMLER
jgi:predicted Na+-dependent transporter